MNTWRLRVVFLLRIRVYNNEDKIKVFYVGWKFIYERVFNTMYYNNFVEYEESDITIPIFYSIIWDEGKVSVAY